MKRRADVHLAAQGLAPSREKAQALLERETRIVLGERDFARFAAAVSGPFEPNPALAHALKEARRKVRRA